MSMIMTTNSDVVETCEGIFERFFRDEIIHKSLKGSGCICHPARHSTEMVQALISFKGSKFYVFLFNWDLMICTFEIDSAKNYPEQS